MSSTRIGRGPERPTRRLRGSSLLSGNESITPTGLRAAGSRAASPTPSRKGLQDQLHPKCFRPRGPVRVTPDGRDLLNTGMKAGLAPFVPASSRELTERGFHWLSTRSGECRSISLPRLPQRPQKGFCVWNDSFCSHLPVVTPFVDFPLIPPVWDCLSAFSRV
jgi:hypothetical protein